MYTCVGVLRYPDKVIKGYTLDDPEVLSGPIEILDKEIHDNYKHTDNLSLNRHGDIQLVGKQINYKQNLKFRCIDLIESNDGQEVVCILANENLVRRQGLNKVITDIKSGAITVSNLEITADGKVTASNLDSTCLYPGDFDFWMELPGYFDTVKIATVPGGMPDLMSRILKQKALGKGIEFKKIKNGMYKVTQGNKMTLYFLGDRVELGANAHWTFADYTRMTRMGYGVDKLDLSELDVSRVTNMGGIFRGVELEELNISGWDTSKVTDMREMFAWSKIRNLIGFENFRTDSLKHCAGMFNGAAIGNLDISSFDISKCKDSNYMFCGDQEDFGEYWGDD
jgi:surface protein